MASRRLKSASFNGAAGSSVLPNTQLSRTRPAPSKRWRLTAPRASIWKAARWARSNTTVSVRSAALVATNAIQAPCACASGCASDDAGRPTVESSVAKRVWLILRPSAAMLVRSTAHCAVPFSSSDWACACSIKRLALSYAKRCCRSCAGSDGRSAIRADKACTCAGSTARPSDIFSAALEILAAFPECAAISTKGAVKPPRKGLAKTVRLSRF